MDTKANYLNKWKRTPSSGFLSWINSLVKLNSSDNLNLASMPVHDNYLHENILIVISAGISYHDKVDYPLL